MSLSVIIIAKNESAAIEACLTSVAWADERIVLDGGSTDDTVARSRALGARTAVDLDWQGFGIQKNRVLDLATHEWVLSLDADEQVSPMLRDEILAVMRHPEALAWYRIPRSSRYCGRALHHGGWWPDYVVRLFRRGQARFSVDPVHERLLGTPGGPLGTLKAPLLHDTYRDLEEALDKSNHYSTLGAHQAYARGQRASLGKAFGRSAWAFFRTLLLRRSFLDGGRGWLLAVSNAHTTFYRYAKLWLLHDRHEGSTDDLGPGSASDADVHNDR